jgi:hypothetical protein
MNLSDLTVSAIFAVPTIRQRLTKDSGAAKEPNWLPAPDGPFYAILRIYIPAPEVVNGTWKKPPLQPAQ